MSFLKIDNLSVNYKMRKETVYAVKKINFEVKKGEILGLVGESGSGKSTLGNAIINLIDEPGKISDGRIILDGVNIHKNPEDIIKYRGKKIGLIFQDPQTSLNPLLTIGEQLIETIQTHLNFNLKESKDRAINLMPLRPCQNRKSLTLPLGWVRWTYQTHRYLLDLAQQDRWSCPLGEPG